MSFWYALAVFRRSRLTTTSPILVVLFRTKMRILKKLASEREQAYKKCAARIGPMGADD
jgi:hypothetical protein